MTLGFQFFDLRFETFADFWGDIIVVKILNHPNTFFRTSFDGSFIIIIWQRSEIFFILTTSNRHQEVKVFRILSKETNYISAGSHRHHTVTRNRAVGRLQTINTVKRGWLTNRTTSIGTSSKRHNIKSNGSGGATGRATGDALKIFGVMGRTEVRIFRGRTVSKSIKICAADHNRTFSFELGDGSGINR